MRTEPSTSAWTLIDVPILKEIELTTDARELARQLARLCRHKHSVQPHLGVFSSRWEHIALDVIIYWNPKRATDRTHRFERWPLHL